jgi:hypothetical protein
MVIEDGRPHRAAHSGQNARRRLERVAHPDGRDVGKTLGHRLLDGASAPGGAWTAPREGLRRPFQGARREDDRKIEAQRMPVDLAQRGDPGLDLAAQHVEGEGVAEPHSEPLGQIGVERNEGRPRIVGRPPLPGDDPRIPRWARRQR